MRAPLVCLWLSACVLGDEPPAPPPSDSIDAPALPPGESRVTLVSSPSGAEVRMGGRRLGTTPLELLLPFASRYQVELRVPGHRAQLVMLETGREASVTVEARLEPWG